MNKIKNKRVILAVLLTVLFIIGYATYTVYLNSHDQKIMFATNTVITAGSNQNYKDEITNLKNKNSDVIGFLEIPNTEFKRVFVQTDNNEFYLTKNINKQTDKNGTPFLDYRVNLNSNKLIIYGHNSKFADMPFNYLMKYYDEKFFNENKYIEIKTDKENKKYEVFSVFTETKDWGYTTTDFNTDDDFLNNIKMLKEKSIYKTNHEIKKGQILILQTCSTKKEYEKYKRKFLIIVAEGVN